MKKVVFLLLTFVLLSVVFVGCNTKVYHWEFEKDVSDVQQISIIYIGEMKNYGMKEIVNLSPIKVIDKSQHENFYEEIKEIKMNKKFRVEIDYPYGDYCFLIDYGNDFYCVLSAFGSGYIFNNDNGYYDFRYGKLDFEQESFEILLNWYLEH